MYKKRVNIVHIRHINLHIANLYAVAYLMAYMN